MLKKLYSFMDTAFWNSVEHTEKRFQNLNPLFRFFVGIGLIIVGIIGIIMPVLPGWIFLVPGIVLAFPFTKKWLRRK